VVATGGEAAADDGVAQVQVVGAEAGDEEGVDSSQDKED
jgi:hypothetical protein